MSRDKSPVRQIFCNDPHHGIDWAGLLTDTLRPLKSDGFAPRIESQWSASRIGLTSVLWDKTD